MSGKGEGEKVPLSSCHTTNLRVRVLLVGLFTLLFIKDLYEESNVKGKNFGGTYLDGCTES